MTATEIKADFKKLDARICKRIRFKAEDADVKMLVALLVNLCERVEKLERNKKI